MRKRQLKRLEARHAKDSALLAECNRIKAKIKFLKKTVKAINDNPNKAILSVAVGVGEEFFGISDCFDFPNEDLIEVINYRISELQDQFKRL